MHGVFSTVGLATRQWFDDGVVHVELDLTADHLMQDDSDLRDWRSAVESLRPILEPAHVVVIGASRDGTGRASHPRPPPRSFTGRVSVVHPSAAVAGGIAALAGRRPRAGPDLAIIAVPAAAVVGVVDECGRAGVAAAVIISAGFAEQDAAGRPRQDELLASARSHGMRIVGPNCLGVVSTRCGLNATFTEQRFRPGGIAIAAQSGGVGIAIAAEAEQRDAGISAFVSMGNKIDVSSNDLLRLWADDADTTVLMLYLESFGDPVRFARVARAVSRRKPIVALKGGRTEPGSTRLPGPTRRRWPTTTPSSTPCSSTPGCSGPGRSKSSSTSACSSTASRHPAGSQGGAHRQRRRAADPRRRHRRRPRPRRPGALRRAARDDHRRRPRRRDRQSRRPDLGDGRRRARRRHPIIARPARSTPASWSSSTSTSRPPTGGVTVDRR